jgi:hypothetical protein
MVIGPKGPETKNDCGCENQQKFTGLEVASHGSTILSH